MTRKPDPRIPSQHRQIARALQATPPPTNWWARRHDDGTPLTRDEWKEFAADAAERMNAVSTTHAINRTGEDR